ncbi:MAG: hypothetical protein HQK54_11225, partial [Oligoflexales bacterium]|nr:hypothetical protein [Oligoflexales bacterium]
AREAEAKLVQATRLAKESQDENAILKKRADNLEKDVIKFKGQAEKVVREMESIRSEYEFAVRSREALEAELAERKSR